MKKRILSMFIALVIMLVSMPIANIGTASAEETTDFKAASSSILSVDRVINDFNDVPTKGTVVVGDKEVNVGIGTNDTKPNVNDYSAFGGTSNTLTIEDGALKSTLSASALFDFYTYISPVSATRGNTTLSSETTALQFHVDFSGITSVKADSKVHFEVRLGKSKGDNGHYTYYSVPGQTFVYIPDATESNPNPEPQILTTDGGVQVYHGKVWGYAGQSGTIIIPLQVWDNDAAPNPGSITDFISCSSDYHNRNYIRFESYNKKYAANDAVIIDDICWMKKIIKEQEEENENEYDCEINAQDFSNITSSDLSGGYGGHGAGISTWKKGTNYSVTDGRLKLTKTCAAEGTGGWFKAIFPIAAWQTNYEALAFDFDISEMINNTTWPTGKGSHIRVMFGVNATDTTAAASHQLDGKVKFIWENGTVTNFELFGSGGNYLPKGFNGKVVIPAAILNLTEAELAGIEAGGQCTITLQIGSFNATQQNTSVYVDNVKYYYNETKLGDTSGVNFNSLESPLYETSTPITDDVRTIEAYLKTEANINQGIIGTKFGSADYHGIFIELNITSLGQPMLTVGSANIKVGNRALNDGQWHHIALTVDEEASEIRCYIDDELIKTVAFDTLTFPRTSDWLPITIGNNMPAESRYYSVFDGSLANIRLWSDVRTAEELAANKVESVGADAEGLVAEWMLNSENLTVDTTGNYPLKNYHWNIDTENELFAQYNRDAAEDEFTIIFLPDTQTIIKNYKDQVPVIFDWIIANAERLKIKAVVSLGDIIEYRDDEEGYATLSKQWTRLTEAGIPNVATIGDHDYNDLSVRDTTYYDKYFTTDLIVENDYFRLGGLYAENDLKNGYYYLDIENGAKFIIMNLEVHARDAVLEWASEVVSENSDCRVIVATHNYMHRPYGERYTSTGYNHGGNAGEAVWQKFLSQHKNIDALFCGHSETSGYYGTYDTGVNGNKVLQLNCDLQNTDQSYKTAAAVLIGRFKNDGSQVTFNLYSTHRNLFIDSDCNDRTYDLYATTEDKVLAEIDGVKYTDLSEALNNANGETINLKANVTVNEQIAVTGKANLNLNGFDLNLANTDNYAIKVENELTISGEGNVNVTGYGISTQYGSNGIVIINGGVFNAESCDYILGCFGGEIIINDGDFNGEYCVANNFSEYYGIEGKITVNGGDFNAENPLLGGENEVAVTGGTFNADISEYLDENIGIKFINDIYTAASDNTIADVDANEKVDASDIVYFKNKIMNTVVDDNYFDINGDGKFNLKDIVRVKKLAVDIK